jgi:hypothetical protein
MKRNLNKFQNIRKGKKRGERKRIQKKEKEMKERPR